MKNPNVDFLNEENKIVETPLKKRRSISKLFLFLLIVFIIAGVSLSVGIISSSENLAKKFGNVGILGQIKHLIGSDDKMVLGEEEDRVNVLLLGMGGENHDGPYLTDTIMVASFRPSTKQVALISIPRDLLVNIPGYGWYKINHANSFGEQENPGYGGELAKHVIGELLDIPIHYYVRIDFEGFKQVIDDIGGITVNVENTLDDYQYPVRGKETATTSLRYEHLHIEAGEQKMDGELALKYVRSRHGLRGEGSDFARSKRQQNVLMAVKNKALSFGTLANPFKVNSVLNSLSERLATDFQVWEILRLYSLGKEVEPNQINRIVFDDSEKGMLYGTIIESGAYVLLPRNGNYTEMRETVEYVFTTEMEKEAIEAEQPKHVEVYNGTRVNGLASKTADSLEQQGYIISSIKNAPTQDYQKTVIYNVGGSNSHDEAKKIAESLNGSVAESIPTWADPGSSYVKSQTDIVVILGQDQT